MIRSSASTKTFHLIVLPTVTLMASSRGAEKLLSRRSKRLRKESSGELSVEELFPDDMAYDADVETLQPDVYEEPESDTESTTTPKKKFHTIDEELAAKMKHLGHEGSETNTPLASANHRGRKRRSLHEEVIQSRGGRTSDLEVVELLEASNASPPKKKLKRSRPNSSIRTSDGACQRRPKATENVRTGQADMNDAMDTS